MHINKYYTCSNNPDTRHTAIRNLQYNLSPIHLSSRMEKRVDDYNFKL